MVINMVAGDSLQRVSKHLEQLSFKPKVSHNFAELFKMFALVRGEFMFKEADKTVVTFGLDLRSERANVLIQKTESCGASVDCVDFRDYIPQSSEVADLSPRLNFLLGGIAAGNKSKDLLIFAHHFELKDSILELNRRSVSVGICCYRGIMDPRWDNFGLYIKSSPIQFFDLTPSVSTLTDYQQNVQPKNKPAVFELLTC